MLGVTDAELDAIAEAITAQTRAQPPLTDAEVAEIAADEARLTIRLAREAAEAER